MDFFSKGSKLILDDLSELNRHLEKVLETLESKKKEDLGNSNVTTSTKEGQELKIKFDFKGEKKCQ